MQVFQLLFLMLVGAVVVAVGIAIAPYILSILGILLVCFVLLTWWAHRVEQRAGRVARVLLAQRQDLLAEQVDAPAHPVHEITRHERLVVVVRGDVQFGGGVRVRGDVRMEAPAGGVLVVPDDTVLGER